MKAFLIGKSYKPQVNPVSNVEAIGVNNKIYLAYKDPDDESRVYTKVVYNEGHFPQNVNDGKIVLNSIVKDEYNVDPLIIEVPENKKYYVTIFVETYAQGVTSRYDVEVNVQKVERLINDFTVEAQGGIVSSEWWGSFTLPEPYDITIREKQIPIIKHWQSIKLKYRSYTDDLPLPVETDLNAYNAESNIAAIFNPLDNGIYNANINDSLAYYKQKENFIQTVTLSPTSTSNNRGFRVWFLDEDNNISGVTNWVIPLKYRDSDIFASNVSYIAKDTSIDFTFTLPSNIDSSVASGGTIETTTVNGYRFSYKKSSATNWSYSTFTSALENQTISASLTGLESNTSYDIKVQIAYKNGRRTTQRYATHSQIESITISTLKSFDWETATWEEVCDQLDYIKENNLDMNDFFSIGMEKENEEVMLLETTSNEKIVVEIADINRDASNSITLVCKSTGKNVYNFVDENNTAVFNINLSPAMKSLRANGKGLYNALAQVNQPLGTHVLPVYKIAPGANSTSIMREYYVWPLSMEELGLELFDANYLLSSSFVNFKDPQDDLTAPYALYTNNLSRVKNTQTGYVTRTTANSDNTQSIYITVDGTPDYILKSGELPMAKGIVLGAKRDLSLTSYSFDTNGTLNLNFKYNGKEDLSNFSQLFILDLYDSGNQDTSYTIQNSFDGVKATMQGYQTTEYGSLMIQGIEEVSTQNIDLNGNLSVTLYITIPEENIEHFIVIMYGAVLNGDYENAYFEKEVLIINLSEEGETTI